MNTAAESFYCFILFVYKNANYCVLDEAPAAAAASRSRLRKARRRTSFWIAR